MATCVAGAVISHDTPADSREENPDDGGPNGEPGKLVACFGSEGTLPTGSAQGSSQPASPSPLEEDNEHHKQADEEQEQLQKNG